jgi:hypothetical protein
VRLKFSLLCYFINDIIGGCGYFLYVQDSIVGLNIEEGVQFCVNILGVDDDLAPLSPVGKIRLLPFMSVKNQEETTVAHTMPYKWQIGLLYILRVVQIKGEYKAFFKVERNVTPFQTSR